jgi:hypothetical protein
MAPPATLSAIRNALATQLAAQITGLRASGSLVGQVNPPYAIVAPATGQIITYVDMSGSVEWHLQVILLASAADEPDSQILMDGYLAPGGTQSVNQAINHDTTLGGIAEYAVLTGAQRYGLMPWGALQYLGCHFLVTVGAR